MSVSDNYVPTKTIGDGSTVDFSFTWPVLTTSYLRVYLENVSTGVQTLQSIGTDYTAVISDSGGVVTFATAPTSSYYVIISRQIAADQTNPYKTSKGYQGSILETSLDKLTLLNQDIDEKINRSISFPIGETASTELPTATALTNKYVFFNGTKFIGSDGTTDTPISSAMTTFVGSATLVDARTELDVYSKSETYAKEELGMVLLAEASANDSSFIIFSLPIEWESFMIVANGLNFATPSILRGTISEDGGITWNTSGIYNSGGRTLAMGSTATDYSEVAQTSMRLSGANIDNHFGTIININRSGTSYTNLHGTSSYYTGSVFQTDYFGVVCQGTPPHTAIRLNAGTGNITSGTFALFGIKRA